jgi:outer membrane immunogenic protein
MRSKVANLLVVAFSLGFAQAASAADMPVKAPMMAPAFSWTGFYAGVHAGGSWSAGDDPDYTLTDPTAGAPFTSRNFAWCGAPAGVVNVPVTSPNPFDIQKTCNNDSSFLGGAQIGYNWQTGSIVYGVEADVS